MFRAVSIGFLLSFFICDTAHAFFGRQTTAGAVETLMVNSSLAAVDTDVNEMHDLLKTGITPEKKGVWQSIYAHFYTTGNLLIRKYMEAYAALMRIINQLEDLTYLLKNADHFVDKFNRLEKQLLDLRDDLNTVQEALNERKTLARTGKPSITMSAMGVLFAKIGLGDTARKHDMANRAAAFKEDIPMLRKARDKVQAEIEALESEQAAAKALIDQLKTLVHSKQSYFSRIVSTGAWVAGKAVGLVRWALRRKTAQQPEQAGLTTADRQVIDKERTRLAQVKELKIKAYREAFQAVEKAYKLEASFLLDKRASLANMLHEKCGKTPQEECVQNAQEFVASSAKDVSACDHVSAFSDLVDMVACVVAYTADKKCKGKPLTEGTCQTTVLTDLQGKLTIMPQQTLSSCKKTSPNPLQDLSACILGHTKVGSLSALTYGGK